MADFDRLQRVSETVWELPMTYKAGMQVPARLYGTESLVRTMDDAVYEQVTNVAMLPGITQYAFAQFIAVCSS
jgi:tRNA-splicing ligase RtcB